MNRTLHRRVATLERRTAVAEESDATIAPLHRVAWATLSSSDQISLRKQADPRGTLPEDWTVVLVQAQERAASLIAEHGEDVALEKAAEIGRRSVSPDTHAFTAGMIAGAEGYELRVAETPPPREHVRRRRIVWALMPPHEVRAVKEIWGRYAGSTNGYGKEFTWGHPPRPPLPEHLVEPLRDAERRAEELLAEFDGDIGQAERALGLAWGQQLPHHWPEDGRFDHCRVIR